MVRATALGAYTNTAEGKLVAASVLDNWNNVVKTMRDNPALQRTNMTARQEEVEKPVLPPPSSVALPGETQAKAPAGFEKGDVLIGKIGGVKVFAEPSEKSKTLRALGRTDTVMFLGRKVNRFLNVQGEKGSGWIDKMFLKRE